ncbi:hypothetical protein DPSP01_008519 [Paraphaeosphaeria sporulosa]
MPRRRRKFRCPSSKFPRYGACVSGRMDEMMCYSTPLVESNSHADQTKMQFHTQIQTPHRTATMLSSPPASIGLRVYYLFHSFLPR